MRKGILYILLSIICSTGFSQYYKYDVGVGLGASNYLGEMGGIDEPRQDFIWDLKPSETRWSVSAFVRDRFSPIFAGKLQFNYLRISGADSLSTYGPRRGRNLSFRNDMLELTATLEVYFLQINDIGGSKRYQSDFQFYAFGGIGGLYSNPKGELDGKWYALQPLKTEGQTKPYSRLNFVIPMGVGFYYTLNSKYRLGMEIGWRKTFTDYLDDVSTTYAKPSELPSKIAVELANKSDRAYAKDPEGLPERFNYVPGSIRGYPSHNDNYMTVNINFSYIFGYSTSFGRSQYKFIKGHKASF